MFWKKYECIICGFESNKAICKSCNTKVTDVMMYRVEKDDSPLVNYLAKLIDGERPGGERKKRNEQI